MKMALNGALTIGTLDGANVEILEEVGDENIFIFGLTTEQVAQTKAQGYNPWDYYNSNVELREVLDMIASGFFSVDEPQRYQAIIDTLLHKGDQYLLLADYASYVDTQTRVGHLFNDAEQWSRKAILNVARMVKFSSDRTIGEYADKIWKVSAAKG
jgi:starch phosphorylase